MRPRPSLTGKIATHSHCAPALRAAPIARRPIRLVSLPRPTRPVAYPLAEVRKSIPSDLIRGRKPVFPRDNRKAFARRSCSNNENQAAGRDAIPLKSHHNLPQEVRVLPVICCQPATMKMKFVAREEMSIPILGPKPAKAPLSEPLCGATLEMSAFPSECCAPVTAFLGFLKHVGTMKGSSFRGSVN